MPAVALAGLRGTLLEQVAALVAARTGWRIWRPGGAEPPPPEGGVVYLGWEGFHTPETGAGVLKVLLVAPWSLRLQRIMSEGSIDALQAAGIAATQAQEEDRRARAAGWAGAGDPEGVHLILNTGRLSAEQAASLIVSAAGLASSPAAGRRRRSRRRGRGRRDGGVPEGAAVGSAGGSSAADGRGGQGVALAVVGPPADGHGSGEARSLGPAAGQSGQPAGPMAPQPVHHPRPAGVRPAFAHPSEEEFARVLDFYRVEWQYEPTTFPLEWDDKGNVTLAFTPDFYIPAWDLYVELTTMKQSLVNRKNRKIRRLRELYPHVRIKTFYGRDFERLLRKFGREEVLQSAAPAVDGAGAPSRGEPAAQVGQPPFREEAAPSAGAVEAAAAVEADSVANAPQEAAAVAAPTREAAVAPAPAGETAAVLDDGDPEGAGRRQGVRRAPGRRRGRPRRAVSRTG